MTEKVMEMVQLENGDVVLRDVDSSGEPVMTLSFSKGVNELLQNAKLDIAKVMLEAGIQRHQEILLAQDQLQSTNSGLLH